MTEHIKREECHIGIYPCCIEFENGKVTRNCYACIEKYAYDKGRADAICGVDRIIQFIKDNSFDNHSFDDSFKVIGSRVIIDLLEQLKEQGND